MLDEVLLAFAALLAMVGDGFKGTVEDDSGGVAAWGVVAGVLIEVAATGVPADEGVPLDERVVSEDVLLSAGEVVLLDEGVPVGVVDVVFPDVAEELDPEVESAPPDIRVSGVALVGNTKE